GCSGFSGCSGVSSTVGKVVKPSNLNLKGTSCFILNIGTSYCVCAFSISLISFNWYVHLVPDFSTGSAPSTCNPEISAIGLLGILMVNKKLSSVTVKVAFSSIKPAAPDASSLSAFKALAVISYEPGSILLRSEERRVGKEYRYLCS